MFHHAGCRDAWDCECPDEHRAFVVVHTKKFSKGELCGKIEDP